jgi:hypothetical protein
VVKHSLKKTNGHNKLRMEEVGYSGGVRTNFSVECSSTAHIVDYPVGHQFSRFRAYGHDPDLSLFVLARSSFIIVKVKQDYRK